METEKKICEICGIEYSYRVSQRKASRCCSISCLSKVAQKKYKEYCDNRKSAWANETREEWLKALAVRFEKYVVRTDNCWDWNGSKHRCGYGLLSHRKQPMKAHRASYLIHCGEILEGLHVLHTCDNPSCSNPKHLFLGTNFDNVQDKMEKGRYKKGPSLLHRDQVREIRKLIDEGLSNVTIGIKYGVSDVAIYNIKSGKTWKNVK